MEFPAYQAPNFTSLSDAPLVSFAPAPADGVAPEYFHATSNYPEYFHLTGGWQVLRESRMDAVVVLNDQQLVVVEARRLLKGDLVALGRREDGTEGIWVHVDGFTEKNSSTDRFSFRSRGTRESAFSASYEWLYELLQHEREHGFIAWVAGPAVAFDKDSRESLGALIRAGYCHAMLAGNALATHDLEAGHFGTGLGQDVYNQRQHAGGHYHHLDIINRVRMHGSIHRALPQLGAAPGRQEHPGIMAALVERNIPFVLAGSIRDDGPLPEVIASAYDAQDAMRQYARQATTVIAMATQLHSIAFGNQLPGYQVMSGGDIRPVYLIVVDTTEFSIDKLANRGSSQARGFLTNVQDFLINLRRNLVTSGTGSPTFNQPTGGDGQ